MNRPARPSPARVPRPRLAYGIGSIGTGIFTTVPSVILLYFLTVEIHIAAAVAGVIILLPKLAGLIGDPLIGRWSDRLRRSAPTGRRILMASGALLTGAGLWALFQLPQLHRGNGLLPTLIYFVCTTGYSLFAVPYSALPAELADNAEDRRALVSGRLGLAFLGTLIGGVSGPLLVARVGYPAMGLILGTVCLVAMSTFLITCRIPLGIPRGEQSEEPGSDAGVANITTRPFKKQIAAFVLLLAAAGAFTALLPFLIRDMNASPDVVGAAMLVNILAALLSSLVWPRLIQRLGLQTVWQTASALMIVSAFMIAFAPGVGILLFLGMVVGGAGFCGVQMAGFTGLADLTAEYLRRGRGGGLVTGIWMAGEKAGLALGPMLAGLGLQYMKYSVWGSTTRSLIILVPTIPALFAILIISFSHSRKVKYEFGRTESHICI